MQSSVLRRTISNEAIVVGIDAGGNKLAVGVGDVTTGQIFERRAAATNRARGGEAVLADCMDLVQAVACARPIAAVGIGVPEIVSKEGEITSAANWDWREVTWSSIFNSVARVHVESDVRAAALAEARFGPGRELSWFLYMSIGTGVSHTFVIGGLPWRGARGNAIVSGAPSVERVASGAALAARTGKSRAEVVLTSKSDEPIVESAVRSLGTELARLVNAFDPEAVVIGGGLGLVDSFRQGVVSQMRNEIYAASTRSLMVFPAALGFDASVIGAAVAAEAVERGD